MGEREDFILKHISKALVNFPFRQPATSESRADYIKEKNTAMAARRPELIANAEAAWEIKRSAAQAHKKPVGLRNKRHGR